MLSKENLYVKETLNFIGVLIFILYHCKDQTKGFLFFLCEFPFHTHFGADGGWGWGGGTPPSYSLIQLHSVKKVISLTLPVARSELPLLSSLCVSLRASVTAEEQLLMLL